MRVASKVGLALTLLVIGGCDERTVDRAAPAGRSSGCEVPFDAAVERYGSGPRPRSAERFRVSYHGHYKVVEVDPPGREGMVERYLLLACGAPRPAGYDDALLFEVPARTAVTTSVTELPAFAVLGLVDRLVGHSTLDYVYTPAVRARIAAGAVAEVGRGGALDLERIVAVAPSVVFADTLGSPELDPSGQLRVLRDAGVPVALVPSYLEPSVLGRAEWVLFVALFFDREAAAATWFEEVSARYRTLAERGRAAPSRPLAITGGPAGDVWHVAGGRSHAAALLADAGFGSPWADDRSTGSVALSFEAAYAEATRADWWIHPSGWRSRADIGAADPRLRTLPAVVSGRVAIHDARVNGLANDYWELAVVRPDLVLADLLWLAHPALVPDHRLVFHRVLGAGGGGG